MRKAFAETIADKELVAEAAKAKMDLNYAGADVAHEGDEECCPSPRISSTSSASM